ncbi:hypothetical protein [Nocardia wallacei]|uniref:hypothetical protein n=1 Tax=Nocardia wallacei TaxID=480035 RepID=UPI00245511D8|nr:hypothetical protein [Nocardia wallacei]
MPRSAANRGRPVVLLECSAIKWRGPPFYFRYDLAGPAVRQPGIALATEHGPDPAAQADRLFRMVVAGLGRSERTEAW